MGKTAAIVVNAAGVAGATAACVKQPESRNPTPATRIQNPPSGNGYSAGQPPYSMESPDNQDRLALPDTEEARAANTRSIQSLSVAERFYLMFHGQLPPKTMATYLIRSVPTEGRVDILIEADSPEEALRDAAEGYGDVVAISYEESGRDGWKYLSDQLEEDFDGCVACYVELVEDEEGGDS